MKIFVVNCGSSSIKYRLFDMADESVLAKGLLERVGEPEAQLHHAPAGRPAATLAAAAPDHRAGMRLILQTLTDSRVGVLWGVEQIEGVGHRVVHGGRALTASARIDADLLRRIRENCELAPLHNPPNLTGIEAAMAAMPSVPHVAVFDTAFLATLPPKAHRYAVPGDWHDRHHVRKYGFHGTSHRYVTLRAAELLGRDVREVNLVTAHLGNGCSITAVAGGQAVDHSMGMTPLEGLVMGTRCGDLDPAVVLYMLERGLSAKDVDRTLNKESGLLGLSGCSNDMRDLLEAAAGGHAGARLAMDVFVYRLAKYVGAYWAILPGVDALVLTGGIGENAAPVRAELVRSLGRLGARLDEQRNAETVGGRAGPISAEGSALPVWVVPTNEELMIARDTHGIVRTSARG